MFDNKLILVVVVVVVCFFINSCNKEEFTKAIIIVVDNENNRVFGATVELSQPQVLSSVQQTNISDLKISDLNGETEHIFALEAIMNINVFKVISGDTLKGENVISLQQGQIVTKKIEIN